MSRRFRPGEPRPHITLYAVEYESRRACGDEASQAMERAGRIVSWARDAVEQGRL